MSSFGKIFTGVKKAKQGSNYGARLPPGQNRVILKKYGPKPTEKEDSKAGSMLIESTYMIVTCTAEDCKEGDSRDWPWFIQSPSWGGVFARQNAQQMIEAIAGSVNMDEINALTIDENGLVFNPITGTHILDADENSPTFGKPLKEHDVQSFGELASDHFFRGVQLNCSVEPSYNKKTKKFNVDKDGKPYYDAKWSAVPGQSLESIYATRANLDEIDPLPAAETATAATTAPVQNIGGYAVQAKTALAPKPDPVPEMPLAQPPAAPAASTAAVPNNALAALMARAKKPTG